MKKRTVEVFFDGDCPLCRREIAWLKGRDVQGLMIATDIAGPGFIPPDGLTLDMLMARLHGRLHSGEVIEGVEVFRQLYALAGLGWWVPLSRLPGIRHLLDLSYSLFAGYRLSLTGRCASGSCGVGPLKNGQPPA